MAYLASPALGSRPIGPLSSPPRTTPTAPRNRLRRPNLNSFPPSKPPRSTPSPRASSPRTARPALAKQGSFILSIAPSPPSPATTRKLTRGARPNSRPRLLRPTPQPHDSPHPPP